MAELQSQIDSISGYISNLTALTKFLNGHPILPLDDAADIVQFDLTTGKGSGDWIGWGICNGTNYPGAIGNIATPDLRNRFIVGSQGSYAVGDTGGLDSVTLITSELPSHTHALTDPGHTHIVTDPGHDHNVTDPGHTHAGATVAHQHTFTTDIGGGSHTHTYEKVDLAGTDYYIPELIATHQMDFNFTGPNTGSTNIDHTHTGITDMATPGVNISAAFTGIDMDDAFTGISNVSTVTGVTIASTGSDVAHENRPPYYALLWIKKIY
jgi:microcystin-dependent protein